MRTVAFSGSTWSVKASGAPVGPGPNLFSDSPDNVRVDGAGRLHLRITRRDDRWFCAEVVREGSLGHGSYGFVVESSLGRLDPNVVLGLFTWSDDPRHHHREIDVEFARWGQPTGPNAQYVVQPFDRPGNLRSFTQPDVAPSRHGFVWRPDRVSFHSAATRRLISSWPYRGPDVPPAGDERARINLWLFEGRPPSDGREIEFVLSAFAFQPVSAEE